MLHLVFCFGVWTLIATVLSWRCITITKHAIAHLQHLHQIPCDKCAYFTGDYRLKCTVNPMVAMSENAIGCRDFTYSDRHHSCRGCIPLHQRCNQQQVKHSLLKGKLTYLFK